MENTDNASGSNNKKGGKLTPAELFQKHIKDPNHVVTEEELKNLKVGVDAEDEKEISKETYTQIDELDHLSS